MIIGVAIYQHADLEIVRHKCFAVNFVKFLKTTLFRTTGIVALGRSEATWEINILEIENSSWKLQQWH